MNVIEIYRTFWSFWITERRAHAEDEDKDDGVYNIAKNQCAMHGAGRGKSGGDDDRRPLKRHAAGKKGTFRLKFSETL